MTGYEYKVIPAPAKGVKAKGIKGPEARFAHALEQSMNTLAAEGWEYLRADILPSEERQGLTSSQTVYRSVLVFRRELAEDETIDIASDTDLEEETEVDETETEEPDAPEEEVEPDTDTDPSDEEEKQPA